MIAVVIVGILASIAMPSYNRYVIASSREAAQTELLQLAAIQEKIYLNSNSYATAADVTGAYDGQATGGLGWTAKTKDGKYSLACNACTQNYFSIEATPVVGTAQAGNGTLIIRSSGQRLWVGGEKPNW